MDDVGAGDDAVGLVEQGQTWTWNTPTTAGAFDGLTLALQHDATTDADIQRLLRLTRPDSGNDAADDVEALLSIENLDTNDLVTTAIEVLAAAGLITTALDVSDAEITNALDIGANLILFSTGSLSPTDLELLDSGDIDLAAEVTGTLPVGNGGTGVTAPTDGGILLGSGTGAVTALGVATNGQIPIGDGTTDPVLATITPEAGNEIIVTNGAGTIELDVNEANLDLASIGGTIGDTQIAAGAVDGGSGGEIADGTVDSNDLATANKTDQWAYVIDEDTAIPATRDINSMVPNRARAVTITEVWCETDTGTATLNWQRDDGTPVDILSADLVCDTNQQTSCSSGCDVNTIQDAEDNVAVGDELDHVTIAVSSAQRVSIAIKYTID